MSQLKNERPYARESVKKLEQIFNTHEFNKKVLRVLSAELKTRTTKNAKLLRGKVQAQLIEIRNREQFWRDKDAKAKAEKKTKPQVRKPESNLLTSPVQPAKQEQASLLNSSPTPHGKMVENKALNEFSRSMSATQSIPETNYQDQMTAPEESQQPSDADSPANRAPSLEDSPKKRKNTWRVTFMALALLLVCGMGFVYMQRSTPFVSKPSTMNNREAQTTIVENIIAEDARKKLSGEPMDFQTGPYNSLRKRGFSDAEIREFMRPLLQRAGLSAPQITTYFKMYDPLYVKTNDPDTLVKNYWEMIENILN